MFPKYIDIQSAAERLRDAAHKTPVITSRTVDRLTGATVFFKCENFQRTGSFKFRGAYNALSQLSLAEREGVITYSSGNHAQALALAGQMLGISATVAMPENAPSVKLAATRGYGAEVILYPPAETNRQDFVAKIAKERSLKIIPPYDYPEIIAGQGTTAKELIEEIGELDLLLICCGGGGLLSGCAIAAKSLNPDCKIVGVEPELGDDATRSFHTKTLQTVTNPQTIADGARTPSLGELTFPLVLQYVDDMVTVSETEIRQTMLLLWERLKLVVEPTGSLGAAALLHQKITAPGKRIGVIISGGNVDLSQLGTIFI